MVTPFTYRQSNYRCAPEGSLAMTRSLEEFTRAGATRSAYSNSNNMGVHVALTQRSPCGWARRHN